MIYWFVRCAFLHNPINGRCLCVQNLLVTGELQLTSVSAVEEYILLGTNTGSVYWYDAVSCTMQRYRTEVSTTEQPYRVVVSDRAVSTCSCFTMLC